jgi:serine/threonine protein kinase
MRGDEITIGSFRGSPIGQGGFATVYRVADSEGNAFALKLVDANAEDAIRESLYLEYSVQSELVHPQIAHAHAFGLHDGRPYIVLDWVDGTELFDHYLAPAASDFVTVLRQFTDVLFFIHHRGWVHGDLKPENFRWRLARAGEPLGADSSLCLLDFGLARPIGDADRPRGAGTVGYCAPEFLRNRPADGRADWYSIGIILYEWIFGTRPYASDEPAQEIGGHLEGVPDFDRPRLRPAPAWADEVIKRLLLKTAEERADDEFALLSWMAEFDSKLDPTKLLNQQLCWHARSESLRLRDHESACLQLLQDEILAGRSVPGLIALWMDKQGAVQTLCALAVISVAVRLILIVVGAELPL